MSFVHHVIELNLKLSDSARDTIGKPDLAFSLHFSGWELVLVVVVDAKSYCI